MEKYIYTCIQKSMAEADALQATTRPFERESLFTLAKLISPSLILLERQSHS